MSVISTGVWNDAGLWDDGVVYADSPIPLYGDFSTTLDFEFSAGGFSVVSSSFDRTLNFGFSSSGLVLVSGESTNNQILFQVTSQAEAAGIVGSSNLSLNFDVESSGIVEEVIRGIASVGFDFSVNSTLEIGVTIFGNSFYVNRIEFTQTGEGAVQVNAALNETLAFNLNSRLSQFTFGTGTGSFDFYSNSKGINYSIHSSDRIGKNDIRLNQNNFNDVLILNSVNGINIPNNGSTNVRIL
jgi:hypothetical protein